MRVWGFFFGWGGRRGEGAKTYYGVLLGMTDPQGRYGVDFVERFRQVEARVLVQPEEAR